MVISGGWGHIINKHLAGILGTEFLLNTKSYGRLHCLQIVSGIHDNTGKLSDLRFQKLSEQYETEEAEIQRFASSLEQEIENEVGQIVDVGRFLQFADRYSDLQELDASTVNELIDRIVIHSPKKINGRKHVTIEIYFTYVGKIRIPLYKPDIPTDTAGVTSATPVLLENSFTSLWASA